MKYGSGWLQEFYNFAPLLIQNVMTSVYGLAHRRKAYGGYFHYYFDHLQETQWLSDAEIAAYQAERVRSFLECATVHSVYWRDQFRSVVGFEPNRIPQLRHPFRARGLPLCHFEYGDIRVASNYQTWQGLLIDIFI